MCNVVHFETPSIVTCAGYIFNATVQRAPFQEHMRRFRRIRCWTIDEDCRWRAEERVNPAQSRGSDHQRADNNGNVGEGVAENCGPGCCAGSGRRAADQRESDAAVYG